MIDKKKLKAAAEAILLRTMEGTSPPGEYEQRQARVTALLERQRALVAEGMKAFGDRDSFRARAVQSSLEELHVELDAYLDQLIADAEGAA